MQQQNCIMWVVALKMKLKKSSEYKLFFLDFAQSPARYKICVSHFEKAEAHYMWRIKYWPFKHNKKTTTKKKKQKQKKNDK